MANIIKINQTEPVQPDNQPFTAQKRRHQKKKKSYRYAKKDFSFLSDLVEKKHTELVETESPFRLCVYQEGDDVYIDIVTLDESGRPVQTIKHDISHEELDDLIAHIKSGRGLILDADA